MIKGNWEPLNSKAIVHNIELIFKSNDINKLNKPTYNFVHNLTGFIAHYDLYGFRSTYEDLRLFADELLGACTENEANYKLDEDFIRDYGRAYCQSEADIINGIREVVLKYQAEIKTKADNKDMGKLNTLLALAEEVKKRNDPETTRTFLRNL